MSSNPHIVDSEELRRISGKKSATAVRRWASSLGIRTLDGDQGPFTTIEALNAALGVGSAANDRKYERDMF